MENMVKYFVEKLDIEEKTAETVAALYSELNLTPEEFTKWALSVLEAETEEMSKEILAVDQREFYDEEGNLFGYSFLNI